MIDFENTREYEFWSSYYNVVKDNAMTVIQLFTDIDQSDKTVRWQIIIVSQMGEQLCGIKAVFSIQTRFLQLLVSQMKLLQWFQHWLVWKML